MVDARVTINISGVVYETFLSTLETFPKTLLGCPRKRQKYYSRKKDEYFFNRNRKAFDAILFYYQSSGKLQRPSDVPMSVFVSEAQFFELNEEDIGKMLEKEGYLSEEVNSSFPHKALQKMIWKCVEPQQSSKSKSKIFGCVSMFFVLMSIILSLLQSVSYIQKQRRSYQDLLNDPWFVTEIILNSWFVLEYTLRLYASQDRLSFIISPLNIVEVLATLPFFILLTISFSTSKKVQSNSVAALRLLRIVRVFRMFKLSYFSRSLRVIKHCLIESLADVGILLLFLIIIVTVSSSFLFYVEFDNKKSRMTSIPMAMWFTLQTVTTIGYGDIVPASALGKLAAAVCAIFGAFTLTLPVLSFVTRFNKLYYINMEKSIRQNRFRRKKFSGFWRVKNEPVVRE